MKTLPLALVVPISSGSDPDVIEIEDCTQVYGDNPDMDEFGALVILCSERSDGGECTYNAELAYPEHHRCLYCKKLTG